MEPAIKVTAPMPELQPFLPNPDTPWMVSAGLFQRVQAANDVGGYKKCPINSSDPEWAFILRYFNWQKPHNRCIKNAYCIHNPRATQQFEGSIPGLEQEAANPFFAPKWQQEEDLPLRQKVNQRWQTMTAPYSPFIIPGSNKRKDIYQNVKVLPLWHGTKAAICNSICQTGFAYFGKHQLIKGGTKKDQNTDVGYFGSGIYFSNSASYGADIYSDGNIFLAWVSMRDPYPVVANVACRPPNKPKDMEKLEGLGAYLNYNAHYIPVISINPANKSCAVYYPCSTNQEPMCDEIVVFQKSQTLPRFWLELDIELPKNPTEAKATIGTLLQKVLDLIESEEVKQDPNLIKILTEKANILIILDSNQTIPAQEQEFCLWAMQLLDQTGKVRNFVGKKLLGMQATSPIQQVPSNSGYVLKTETVTNKSASLALKPLPPNPSEQAEAMYDYTSQDDNMLSFKRGDQINILQKTGDWWMGELKGKRGYVPSNFVQLVRPRLPTLPQKSVSPKVQVVHLPSKCTQTLKGHCVNALVQLADGTLASGSDDQTIMLWQ